MVLLPMTLRCRQADRRCCAAAATAAAALPAATTTATPTAATLPASSRCCCCHRHHCAATVLLAAVLLLMTPPTAKLPSWPPLPRYRHSPAATLPAVATLFDSGDGKNIALDHKNALEIALGGGIFHSIL